MDPLNISFAGAGKVAGALCRPMHGAGNTIDLIVSETSTRGSLLADSCSAKWSDILEYPGTTRLIVVAVPDHKLTEVLEKIRCDRSTLVVHTAGSIGLDVFPEHIMNKGVFYPLQTFSVGRHVDFHNLPIFIESSDNKSSAKLKRLAESIGGKVHFIDTEHRRMLHLAAVFSCNFTNHMLTVGKEIALKAGLSFDVLEPLIKETISKAIETGPERAQTGPAVRGDKNTIAKHIDLLSFSPELQQVYNDVTASIIKHQNKVADA